MCLLAVNFCMFNITSTVYVHYTQIVFILYTDCMYLHNGKGIERGFFVQLILN
jgi:hypothetical protein